MMRHEPAKSAIRALECLSYFDQVRHPLRLRDFCAHFDYPVSSTEELLKTLVRHGYLTFDPAARTYLPALKVGAMGAWLSDSLFSGGRLTAAVKDLQQRTGETVCVTGVNDLHCEIIYGLSSSTRPSHLHTGAARPLVLSALGRVWLSRHPDELIERVYRRSAASGLFNRGAALTLHAFMDVVTPLRDVEVACLEDTWPEPAGGRPTTVFATDVPTLGAQRRLVLGVGGPTDRIVPKLATIREAIGMWRVKLGVPEMAKKDVFHTH